MSYTCVNSMVVGGRPEQQEIKLSSYGLVVDDLLDSDVGCFIWVGLLVIIYNVMTIQIGVYSFNDG